MKKAMHSCEPIFLYRCGGSVAAAYWVLLADDERIPINADLSVKRSPHKILRGKVKTSDRPTK